MPKVFVSGSRSITQLPAGAMEALDTIMAKGLTVLVGDCWGVDYAVQQYLHQKGYDRVHVYHAYSVVRNLVNQAWVTRWVQRGTQRAKDRAMAMHADYGLVVWDGVSPGSAANIAALSGKYTKVIRP